MRLREAYFSIGSPGLMMDYTTLYYLSFALLVLMILNDKGEATRGWARSYAKIDPPYLSKPS